MRYVPVSHDTYLKNNGETTAERLVYLILTIYGYTFKQKETFCVSIPKAMWKLISNQEYSAKCFIFEYFPS